MQENFLINVKLSFDVVTTVWYLDYKLVNKKEVARKQRIVLFASWEENIFTINTTIYHYSRQVGIPPTFFQPFNWLLLKWIIVYIFLKKGFFFIELDQLTENWNWPRELKLIPSPFCHYLMYIAVLSQFEAIPRKPQQV